MRRNNKKKGFTIVELVIVIAVIAVLAGVLIPTFATIVSNAKLSAAEQDATNAYKEALAIKLSDGEPLANGETIKSGTWTFTLTVDEKGNVTGMTSVTTTDTKYSDYNITYANGAFTAEKKANTNQGGAGGNVQS